LWLALGLVVAEKKESIFKIIRLNKNWRKGRLAVTTFCYEWKEKELLSNG
jgi:hypothetical protein